MAGGFDSNTRRQFVPLPLAALVPGGGVVNYQIPRVGFLASIVLYVAGAVGGTVNTPNALGMASIVKNVRLSTSAGTDIFNLSGAGYHYLLRYFIDSYNDPVPAGTPGTAPNINTNARVAVSATDFNVSMLLPVAVNSRDPVGLINLQNENTQLQLSLTCEAQTTVGGSTATYTGSVQPYLELFTVPQDEKDYPPFNVVHQIVETTEAIPASGDYTYNWPRANMRYLQTLHGVALAQSLADSWSAAKLRVNQTQYIYNYDSPRAASYEFAKTHPTGGRPLGMLPWDFMGSSGLGMFDKLRDTLDVTNLTDVASIITATGAVTLTTIRRMLVPLAA